MNDEKEQQLRRLVECWREQAAKWRRYGDMAAERAGYEVDAARFYAKAADIDGCAQELEKALDGKEGNE